ncbi:MAG: hypothetical protein BWY83_01146 [bacterium ADurb.Bin478]|nr:MAG: hypothetical protein BWY83_01146 [bacterium ADurb.Bin478]
MPGAVMAEQSGERRVRRIAEIIFRRQNGDRIVFHFAVAGQAGVGELLICAETKAQERCPGRRVGRQSCNQTVRSGGQRLAGEELFAGVRPTAVVIEIRPAVEITVSGGGYEEGQRAALGQMAGIEKLHAVLIVVCGQVVAAGLSVRLTVCFRIDQSAEAAILCDDVTCSVLAEQGGKQGIRRIAEIKGQTGGLYFHTIVDMAVRPDVKTNFNPLARGLRRDLEKGELKTMLKIELGRKRALCFHKAGAVRRIWKRQLRMARAIPIAVHPFDQMIVGSGYKFTGALHERPFHLYPDIFRIVLPISVGDIDLGDDKLRLGTGVGGGPGGDGLSPEGQIFRIVPPDRSVGCAHQCGQHKDK